MLEGKETDSKIEIFFQKSQQKQTIIVCVKNTKLF